MKILITGGAGFIGSHAADILLEAGHEVTVLDNLSSGRISNIPEKARFIELDIRDEALGTIWEKEKFEGMIHLAAQMDVRQSVMNPLFDSDVNIRGTINLMEIGRKNGLKKVVFTSTGGAGYDDAGPFPTPETIPARPISPYGIAKISTEMYLRYYHLEYGIPYVALRLANVYGPRQNPHGEAGVVAIFIERMLKGENTVINGDGLQTRDYVFCKEVAKAINLAVNSEKTGYFNIGSSVETNVVEIFQLIKESLNLDIPQSHGPAKSGEVQRSVLDAQLAGKELGWFCQVSLKEGIQETVEFFRRQLKNPDAR